MGKHTSAGRPRKVDDDELIAAVREVAHADRVATTSDVVDRVALSRRAVQKRLRKLRERDAIESKEVGARGRVWWVEDDDDDAEHEQAGDSQPAIREDTSRADATAEAERPPQTGAGRSEDADVFEAARAYLRDEKPAWSDQRHAEGAEAVEAAVDYLQKHDTAQKRHFLENVRPDHPAGYPVRDDQGDDEDGRDRSGWWRHVIRPMLKRLPTVDYNGGWYRYVGDEAENA